MKSQALSRIRSEGFIFFEANDQIFQEQLNLASKNMDNWVGRDNKNKEAHQGTNENAIEQRIDIQRDIKSLKGA